MKATFYVTGLLFVLCLSNLQGQRPHPAWRNYTPDDGLPASEVHYCLETPDGYMWFATDNGLSRFDGYSFKNYGAKEGLGDPVIFYMQLDTVGRLWLATMSGRLYYLEQGRIIPCPYNEAIKSKLKESTGVKQITNIQPRDFYIDEQNNKYIRYRDFGIMQITPGDSLIHHMPALKNAEHLGLDVNGRWLFSWSLPKDISIKQANVREFWDKGIYPPIEIISDSTFYIENVIRSEEVSHHWLKMINGTLYLYSSFRFYELKKGVVSRVIYKPSHFGEYKRFYENKKGQLFVASENGAGLLHYDDFEDLATGSPEILLPGTTPSHIFEDSRGNFWVSTTDNGLFVANNMDWEIYDQSTGLASNLVSSIAVKNESELFVGLRLGNIYQVNSQEDQITLLPPFNNNNNILYDMAYHPGLDELWIGITGHYYFKDGKWGQVLHNYYDEYKKAMAVASNVLGRNLSLQKNGNHLWGGNINFFGGIDILNKKAIIWSHEKIPVRDRTLIAHQTAEDTIWVGNTRGLFLLKGIQDTTLHRPEPFDSLLATRIEDLAELSDGSLAIASKGQGVLVKKGPVLRVIDVDNGLTTDMIENVYVDERDNIWAGTLNGLNKISGFSWKDSSSLLVRQYTTHNGLPSNEVNKVESIGNDIWVATNNGLLHFIDRDTINTISSPPILEKLIVNGVEMPFVADTSLSYDQNSINIQYLTINFRQDGDILYRYRLLPNQEEWVNTKGRSINFSSLKEGNYTFEVQSQNEDKVWSNTTAYSFNVLPPFWRSWWFRSLAALMLGLIAYSLYKYRTNQLKQEAAIALQMSELERSALRAQMNPHFIFNSLNSISNFINKGDKRSANHYLSTFAKLIRGILNHSRSERISLEDELQVLNNYMKLEQLRFERRFDFHIELAEGVEPFEIEIPPMMVQPFIENAIIHGLSRKEGPGKIGLKYELQNGHLKVSITDNGVGITQSKASKANDSRMHRSVGMAITKKRLEMLSDQHKQGRFEVEELKDAKGNISGTQVQVWIPIA
ncbi:MAG: histidine kinase [Lewinellaceae bacterium]|nr:histidine kinase [Lewinellaceae bacterium]